MPRGHVATNFYLLNTLGGGCRVVPTEHYPTFTPLSIIHFSPLCDVLQQRQDVLVSPCSTQAVLHVWFAFKWTY